METGKSLLVSFETSRTSNDGNTKETENSLTKEISLDYSDDDIEMLSDTEEKETSPKSKESPKKSTRDERNNNDDNDGERDFAPIDDVDIFAVDDSHLDTSGGEIRRRTKFETEKSDGPTNIKRYLNPNLTKTDETDNFFNSDEQKARRVERAKRFGLESSAKEESTSGPVVIDELTPEISEKLYEFFGIDPENARHKSKYRLNAVYLRGVDHLSTEKIFEYFGLYNPSYLEWIDDVSCNVVWIDQKAAARALLGMSRPLKRIRPKKLPVEEGQHEDSESPSNRRSSSEERDGNDLSKNEEETPVKVLDDEEPLVADVSQFTIPPGIWRVGKYTKEKELILMRFSTIDDVKPIGAHRKSRYYREHGNPNFGGQTGFISRSYMDRMKSRKRSRVNDDDQDQRPDLRQSIDDRERWKLLRDDLRRDPELEPGELVEEEDLATGQVKLTYFSDDDEELNKSDEDRRTNKKPRMRMRADEEADRKDEKRRRLRQMKPRDRGRRGGVGSGVDGDWKRAQIDLRDVLKDSRMKVTVANDRSETPRDDLRRRLGNRGEEENRDGLDDDDY